MSREATISEPSPAVRLFGTEEPVAEPRLLKVGKLSAELEAGNLRYIRYDGLEVLRAVSFIVRNRNWGTYNPEISSLSIEENPTSLTVTYDAVCKDESQELRYSAEITASSNGRLAFRARGRAVTDFVTNRTGFVVLHPAGVAGLPVEIEHVDGSLVPGRFPALIDPVQPMMDLRALTHEAAPGLTVTCRMEGDTFEMEDQRNWSDASYKTYVRPLALPWPYILEAGSEIEQAVTVAVAGAAPARAAGGGEVSVALGERVGRVPALGLGLDPDDAEAVLAKRDALAQLKPSHLVCHHDPRRGHGPVTLERCVAAARALGAEPWLEAVIASVDSFEDEVAALGEANRALGSPFKTVLISPASDLKSTLPGTTWPPSPPLDALHRAARAAFPDARLGGGMFSYFTELNRKRPPADLLDLVTFTTSAIVHAGDDRSVMESLEALPSIAESARFIAGGKPIVVGPSAMGMRSNPYGAAPMENPQNIRQAMSRSDPRQRGLLGAAWSLGYVARLAYGGADAVALGGAVGPFGLVHTPQACAQPWFDEAGGLYPAFHVVRGVAALGRRDLLALDISAPGEVQGLAAAGPDGREIWLANLTAQETRLALPDLAGAEAFVLDAERFAAASRDPAISDRANAAVDGALTLPPYAVARLRA
jgi:hypothetical protein